MSGFVHLHNHSDFSLLKGAARITTLVARARELGMDSLALTDDGNLFGALEFYKECVNQGIKPIIGCDFFVAPESRHRKSSLDGANRNGRVVLLARNRYGYKSLIRLSSIGYLEGFYYRPRIDHEVMEQHRDGLICLTGSLAGEVPRLLLSNRYEDARSCLQWYRDVYGPENVYIELCDHGIPEQRALNPQLRRLAHETGTAIVAANDTHYATRDDANAQDILLCIGSNKKRDDASRFKFSSDEFYLKSAEEMAGRFAEVPEALTTATAIAERCVLQIELPGPKFPSFEIPDGHENRDEYLRHLVANGLAFRYKTVTDEIRDRANYELDTIISMGFTGYFLIVWDFIRYARERDIPVGPGRGSGAGSIVAYALQITDVEPLKYGLLFERFLNPERVSMPDFDIDFCFERRGEVIDYVTSKYGREKVGQIITFGTLKAKSVIRDVARVLGLDYDEADAIAKLVPKDLKMTLDLALEQEPELAALAERGPVYAELIDVSRRLEGFHRHASTHAAGIVIGDEPLTEYVPLYRDPKTGSVSTQFTMDQLEEAGLVKMDFLGLKTLTLIRDAERLIRAKSPDFDIERIPEVDKATFELLGRGQSVAIFQFESAGMQDILRRAKPNKIEDLIALNALYRPGPMQFIGQFVDSKSGATPISYPLPALESVLEETYGVIVYQEQVMQIAQIVGDFSLGKADILRRAMGKKKEKEMALMEQEFISGAQSKGYSKEQALEIFELLKPFAGYGFNKSHAAAYSVLAYQTAYLKANFPVEFFAANLTNEISNSDTFADYLREARALGITVLPPDINQSTALFGVLDEQIVYGLVGIKNVGGGAVEHIIEERASGGQFRSFLDFLERIDTRMVNRKVIETLVHVGAFDNLGTNRATLADNLPIYTEGAKHARENRLAGQSSLFEDDAQQGDDHLPIDPREEWSATERLDKERTLLGGYFSGHPLDDFTAEWKDRTTLNLARIDSASSDITYQLVGLLRSLRITVTKRGERMAIGVIEDYRGEIEFVAFAEAYAKNQDALELNKVVGVTGKVKERRDTLQFVLEEVKELEQLTERDADSVHIRLRDVDVNEESLYTFRGDLGGCQGQSNLFLHIGSSENDTVVRVSSQLRVSSRREILERIQRLPLVEEVWKA